MARKRRLAGSSVPQTITVPPIPMAKAVKDLKSIELLKDKEGKFKPFVWSAAKDLAAFRLACGEMNKTEIAREAGSQLGGDFYFWGLHPEFQARIAQWVEEINGTIIGNAIAQKHHRIKVLNDLEEKLLTIINERARDYVGMEPGLSTGLIAKSEKVIGGVVPTFFNEYKVDTSVIQEIRALHKQAAQEMGQWTEKSDIQLQVGVRREYVVVTVEDATPLDPSTIEKMISG